MVEKGKQMTSVRMSVDSHTIIKLIKKRYKDEKSEITTQDDAFLAFIQEHHQDLYNEAIEAINLKRRLNEIFGDDDE